MTKKSLLLTLACCVAGLSPAAAAETCQAVAPAACAEACPAAHPFLNYELYPAWSKLTPEQAVTDIRFVLQQAQAQMDAICSIAPENTNFENIFGAFEKALGEVDRANGLLFHLGSVMDSPAMRQAQETLLPELTQFQSGITANKALWQAIKGAAAQPWVKSLSAEKQRYVQQVLDSFRDSGADLSPEKQARKAEIQKELSTLEHDFEKKVLDSTNAWQLLITDKAQLEGMSDTWMQQAAEAAHKKGFGSKEKPQWLITLDYSCYGNVMRNCSVEATRKTCWEGICSIGKGGENDTAGIVARVMELRKELAELLGFKTFADMQTAHRMVGSGDKAMAFIDEMMREVKPAFDKECADFLAYVSQCKGEKVEKLNPWDRNFYANKMSKTLYDFDPETLRPYQAFENVYKGMFSLAGQLYGIRIEELPTACLKEGESLPEGSIEVWHPGVKAFKLTDTKTGAHLGSFYMDIFPRSSKRAGAWVMGLGYGEPSADGKPHSPHLATLCGNLTPATADKPALFSQYDAETLFHEFGHMLHVMLGDTELRSHCGTSVAWDFVELPSQINENWTWRPEGMASYARHYQTGAALPKEILDKHIASRYFMPATDNMNQLCVGKLDLEMHMNYDKTFKGKDLDDVTNSFLAPWRIASSVPAPSIFRTLTHCVSGGYAGGYYSYKWAEVLAADAFTRFEKEGVLNSQTGADFRRCILSKGDSKPAAELYRDFMGRDPNPKALLQAQGLLPKDAQ